MKKKTNIIIALGVAIALGATAFSIHLASKPSLPQTYAELTALSTEEIKQIDIALMNLLCAQDLPGTVAPDTEQCLRALDYWAAHIKRETDRHLYRLHKTPDEYDYSEGKFKMLMMAAVIVEDIKCDYNRKLIDSGVVDDWESKTFFKDASDIFIHGLLSEKKRGTCSSMPVLIVSLGRRLGYPLKLVTTKGHLFARREGSKEKFNIDGAGLGFNFYHDEHYLQWPVSVTQHELQNGIYLKSLTPAEELAVFLSMRASCLLIHKRVDEAKAVAERAINLSPKDIATRGLLASIKRGGEITRNYQA